MPSFINNYLMQHFRFILYSSTGFSNSLISSIFHQSMISSLFLDYIATSWMTENPTITTRTVTYNMALNNTLGPKSTSVTEKQVIYFRYFPFTLI